MKFDAKYNFEDYKEFLGGFLPEDLALAEKELIVGEKYKHIKSGIIIGECPSLGLKIFELEHEKEKDPRVLLAGEAFKILAENWSNRALVVLKSKNSDNWRLSYMTISFDINEKNKIAHNFSNARRYSFFLGPKAKIRTPEKQLIGKGTIKDNKDLLERFSIEVVNKEFYKEIQKFFDLLVKEEYLKLPSVVKGSSEVKDFAVRLIGRVMFCWFLKQKMGDNGSLIPDEILSSLSAEKNANYYHVLLEPLFFEVLNTSRDDRNVSFRNGLYDLVPYLNGGLFNPQAGDFYDFDSATYSSRYINTLKIKDEWFIEFFKLLETYNFTIDENTTIDQELSVDPEMLGIIFENLLGEIDADTGESSRKKTGSFYTPRPIVEYMVDKSIAQYLIDKTNIEDKKIEALVSYNLDDDKTFIFSDEEKSLVIQAINNLRVIDPACGSGAFPIGMLQKVLHVLRCVDPDCEIWFEEKLRNVPELIRKKIKEGYQTKSFDYIRKLSIIKDSIFGVDIQHIAVEVSRLRCFLTLIVESEIDDNKPNRNIDPLPNLDFKFVCANTLIPAPEGNVGMFGDENDIFQREFEQEVEKYFTSSGQKKSDAMNKIHRLIDKKIKEKISSITNFSTSLQGDKFKEMMVKKNNKQIDNQVNEMALWESYKNIFENKSVDFFEIKYFFPNVKNGFDICIGNPPYGAEVSEKDAAYFKSIYKMKTRETAILFIEKGYNLLNVKGIESYIIPKSFTYASNYSAVRDFTEKEIAIIVDCGKAFEQVKFEASVIILHKGTQSPNYLSVKFEGNNNFRVVGKIDKILKSKFGFYPNGISKQEIELGIKVCVSNFYLKDIVTNSRGELLQKFVCNEGDLKVIGGKEIDRHGIRGVKGFIDKKYSVGDKCKIHSNSLLSQNIIAHITKPYEHIKIIACIPNFDNCVITDTINQLIILNSKYSQAFVWALLNSKLINWYAYFFIFGKAIRTMHFDNAVTDRIPVPLVISDNKGIVERIEKVVEKILSIKKDNSSTDISYLEKEIDDLVYSLYDLVGDEIKIVENSQ